MEIAVTNFGPLAYFEQFESYNRNWKSVLSDHEFNVKLLMPICRGFELGKIKLSFHYKRVYYRVTIPFKSKPLLAEEPATYYD